MRTLLFYVLLPIIGYLGLKRPFWGLAIYLSANIIRPEMLFWGGSTGAIVFRVSIGAALLGYLSSGDRVKAALERREFRLLLWLWLAVVASLLFADIPLAPGAWGYSEEFLKLVIVGWLVLGLVTDGARLRRMTDVLLAMASLLALWGWEQSFRGNARLEGLGGDAFGDSNGVAAFAVLFVPLALHKLLTATNRNQRLFGCASTLLLGVMIVFTQSRGGFLGLAVGGLYLFWRTPKKKAMVSGMIALVLLASPFVSDEYTNRISTISTNGEDLDISSGSRLLLWRAGWLVFTDHPLFGVGLLNYARAKIPYKYALEGEFDSELLDYSFQGFKVGHSTWFCQILAEGGLFLAIPYFWLILGLFFGARRVRRARPPTDETRDLHNLLIGLEAGVFGYCVSISFIDGLLSPFLPVQLLLGMQILRVIEEENGTENIGQARGIVK